jgi:hypothetical protein
MSQTKAQLLEGNSSQTLTISSAAVALGSAAAPTITFTGDTNTGIYSSGADQVSVTTGGTERLRIDSTGQIEVVSLGTAAAPVYSFTTDPNTGIYSPGADQVAISTGGTGRLFVDASGRVGIGKAPSYTLHTKQGAAVSYGYALESSADDSALVIGNVSSTWRIAASYDTTGSFQPITFFTSDLERMRLDSSGRLGLGTSSPSYLLHVSRNGNDSQPTVLINNTNAGGNAATYFILGSNSTQAAGITLTSTAWGNYGLFKTQSAVLDAGGTASTFLGLAGQAGILFGVGANPYSEVMRIDSSGRVGIGTTTPGSALDVAGEIRIYPASGTGNLRFGSGGVEKGKIAIDSSSNCIIETANNERVRIDSSGRLLVGTSTARTNLFNSTISPQLQVEGTSYPAASISLISTGGNYYDAGTLILGKGRGGSIGSNTIVTNGSPPDIFGYIAFQGNDGTEFVEGAAIKAEVDGTPGANDMPGRLVFSTTADGASSPTERTRITNAGDFLHAKTTSDDTSAGFRIAWSGGSPYTSLVRAANPPLYINRITNDGTLVELAQDGTTEGTISVSGTTVSYNGAHLSRWSQLPGGAERTEILRGTVLSNIDEMCGWGEEANEQLNRMKVSDVEGDPNVAGVFQCWDDDDDTYIDDFYCAMTGDFIIRISAGIPVHRGQLLMSAGDGTAKPQDDDIVRSKTIAKVTSNHITCTYDDGSYCVPCVLMAC